MICRRYCWKYIMLPLGISLCWLNGCSKRDAGGSDPDAPAPVADTMDKFPRMSDTALLTMIEKQTLTYFYNFAHPGSGMVRERNTDLSTVTTGGTGMGIMCLLAGASRALISRQQCLDRLLQITDFLAHKAVRYHGAYAHWMDGVTGQTLPFSPMDDGADLVETAFLMSGLLAAQSYFDGTDSGEQQLRAAIQQLWEGVEWDWFLGGGNQAAPPVLYWHWSPDFGWAMDVKIQGWNEALIVYLLAAAAPTHSIDKEVYDHGWAGGGAERNGKTFYGIQLPLGPDLGGPLFTGQYSFFGLQPARLKDAYADYQQQNRAQALINYRYCVDNPGGFAGYDSSAWGLTASEGPDGYNSFAPDNDQGVIAPTAAVASINYTPEESMRAIRFFYYKKGDQLWGDYGFRDAFCEQRNWYATATLAIDQAPQIIMIENYRSGLLWHLFMNRKDIRGGLQKLGFTVQ